MSVTLPETPTADDFRALARSSPWRFRMLHWTHRHMESAENRTVEVDAWLRRPGCLTVQDAHDAQVVEGVPYRLSTMLARPAADEPGATPDPIAGPGLAPPDGSVLTVPSPFAPPRPTLRSDGLVAARPAYYHLTHGDPMWQSYLWTAMLDPEELAHDVDLTDVYAADRLSRRTWWATARARPGYDPRCGCCPLLLGRVSVELEYGPFDDGDRCGWETPWEDLPTAYLVGLDVQTGIVVDLTPLDGCGGTRLSNEIHAVDEELTTTQTR